MKRFIVRACAFAAVLLVLAGVLAGLFPVNRNAYLQIYNDKNRRLDSTSAPRIIFAGGSNLAFGLDSHRIADSLSLPVVNTSLHAGLGLRFIVDDLIPRLGEGDLLVLAPEYVHFFGNSAYGEARTLPGILEADVRCLEKFDLRQWMTVIKGLPSLLLGRADYLVSKIRGENSPAAFAYLRSGFNEYGDEVSHWKCAASPFPPATALTDSFNDAYFRRFAAQVRELRKKCRVLLLPPTLDEKSFCNQQENIALLQEKLKEAGLAYAAEPGSFVYPADCLFNTEYHLNKKGVDLNTGKIITLLQDNLKSHPLSAKNDPGNPTGRKTSGPGIR